MGLNAKAIAAIEQDLGVARQRVADGQINPEVSDDAQLIAAAILQAGAQIALAVAAQDE